MRQGCKKQIVKLFLCGCITAGLLAGCGTDQNSTDIKQESVKTTQTKEKEHEAITITSYNNGISDEFIEALHEVYPEIVLERSYYCGANGSGYAKISMEQDDMTDIYVGTYFFGEDIQKDRFVDLSSYDFVNKYSTILLNSVNVEGEIFLLPSGYNITGMYYNKTIMEENGWSVPNSLKELEELIPQIKAAGYTPVVNALELAGAPFNDFFSFGNTVWFQTQEGTKWKKDFLTGEATAAGQQGFLEAAQYFQRWIDEGILTAEHTEMSAYMTEGKAVFFIGLGLSAFEREGVDGTTYEFGIMPWLSEDGKNNMLIRNVSRFYGINKHLEEAGNEQKLEDAIHVMEFLSSEEGLEAVMGKGTVYAAPLEQVDLPEDHPYHEVEDLITSGNMVSIMYLGWEDYIIPLGNKVREMFAGELRAEELGASFDEIYRQVNAREIEHYGVAKEIFSKDDTMRLVAIAEVEATEADCALISVNDCHGAEGVNYSGVGSKLYAGLVDNQKIDTFRPYAATLSVIELTGGEIKALQAGGYDINESGNPYEYRLYVKGDETLSDEKTYRLVTSTRELLGEYAKKSTELTISPAEAIAAYTSKLGEFGVDDIGWE